MTTEQRFFLRVLGDHLHGRATRADGQISWSWICRMAEQHMLGPIFYVQCGDLLADRQELTACYDALSDAFAKAVYQAANQKQDDRTLRAALRENGIPFLPIKGPEVAAFYPEPALRTMSDIDLLVRAEDRERIQSALSPLGFSLRRGTDDEWIYLHRASLFELHSVLLRPDEDDNPVRTAWFNDFWSHRIVDRDGEEALDWDFHFLYLVAHIAKHIRGRGIGFRQFYDLAMLTLRGGDRLHWDRIQSQAEKISLLPFLQNCMGLCQAWFDLPSPLGPVNLPAGLTERVTERVFRDGVFGFGAVENNLGLLERRMQESRLPLPLLKLKTAAELLFPPYRQLITAEKYSFLRGHPVLLPYAWAKRLLAASGNRGKRSLVTVLLSASAADVEQRHRQIKELGL